MRGKAILVGLGIFLIVLVVAGTSSGLWLGAGMVVGVILAMLKKRF